MGRYRLGIDIGGTFTDFSLLDESTGELRGFKSPTVPGDPGRGVLDGLRALAGERQLDFGDIEYLAHGTTIAVNTVIQRNGATLGLLVTAGFGDVLEIQRLRLASPVNFTATRPAPLVPRYRVAEVTERILADGAVDTALDELFAKVLSWGGVITGEHGIGLAKKRWWPQATSTVNRSVHEALKTALDSEGILNPGKFVRVASQRATGE